MRKIAFVNQKGGVGKSTSCINIAAILGSSGYKVLIIDCDPQHNTTSGIGIDQNKLKGKITIYECITKNYLITDAIIETNFENVYIVPSTLSLANAEIEISSIMGRETLLNDSIVNSNLDSFDYILFDLPPTLGLLSINGLTATDEIIIPVDAGVFALEGIEQLVNTIKLVKKKFNSTLSITGVLLTKATNTKMTKKIYLDLKEIFGDIVFDTYIRQNITIGEAQEAQKPVTYFSKNCNGAIDYINVTKELLER